MSGKYLFVQRNILLFCNRYGVCLLRGTNWVFTHNSGRFIDAFAKVRKATISFFVSVSLSVRTEQLGSHCTDFHEMLHVSIFRKSVEKIQVSLKHDKTDGHFT
jgi:hypothetical protein